MRHCDDVTSKELLIAYITLAFNLSTAPRIYSINSSTDINSCRNYGKLSVWCLRIFILFPTSRIFNLKTYDVVTSKELLVTYITLAFNLSTAPRICSVNSSMDIYSCRNYGKLSVWCLRSFYSLPDISYIQSLDLLCRDKQKIAYHVYHVSI